MVNSMLSYSGLSQGFWGEAMLTACYLLNMVPNKKNRITPYELWTKKKPNLNYLRVWGCRAVVRLFDPKLKTLGERGIECIFVRYADNSKALNDSVSINSIIESMDVIFDENRLSSVPKPRVTEEVVVQQHKHELRKSKRNRTPKNFGLEFQLYLIERTKDEVSDQHFYCFNVEDDPKTFNEAIKSQDVAFWKEAINDEMDSIMGNNTWVLADLPPGCKPFGCKWIFKRKLKVDGTIEKFKARLVIQGFRQKSGIDYFDTYALVAHINTIRLLIALASIYNLIIHQMDVKTTFLNGVINCLYVGDMLIFGTVQAQVDLIKEFLSSRFSMKDIREADVILGIRIKHESNGIAISQSHYIEKVLKKFNYFDCTLVSTPIDTSEKLMPNNGKVVSQLEYSRVIGCLMYDMTCTRLDIAFVVGKLNSLSYTRYPSVLKGYTDASWISNTDNSSTSGWLFLLGGGAISYASKKQTCIIRSTMESEFVALAATVADEVHFAGADRPWSQNNIRSILIDPCTSTTIEQCKFFDCNSGICDKKPHSLIMLFMESEFCLHPPGDSATRKSVFDSLTSGCIHVIFDPFTPYYQYPWHFPPDHSKYLIFIDQEDVKDMKVNVVEILIRVTLKKKNAMTSYIAYELMPKLDYGNQKAKFDLFQNAFSNTINNLIERVKTLNLD
ncbi:zinc finger, CCHC-type containing protein [Tanacetum coccineum]